MRRTSSSAVRPAAGSPLKSERPTSASKKFLIPSLRESTRHLRELDPNTKAGSSAFKQGISDFVLGEGQYEGVETMPVRSASRPHHARQTVLCAKLHLVVAGFELLAKTTPTEVKTQTYMRQMSLLIRLERTVMRDMETEIRPMKKLTPGKGAWSEEPRSRLNNTLILKRHDFEMYAHHAHYKNRLDAWKRSYDLVSTFREMRRETTTMEPYLRDELDEADVYYFGFLAGIVADDIDSGVPTQRFSHPYAAIPKRRLFRASLKIDFLNSQDDRLADEIRFLRELASFDFSGWHDDWYDEAIPKGDSDLPWDEDASVVPDEPDETTDAEFVAMIRDFETTGVSKTKARLHEFVGDERKFEDFMRV